MVSTAIARGEHRIVLALTFDYGQRAAKREIAAAKKLCRLWNIRHKVICLPWLKEITGTALVNRSSRLPVFDHRSPGLSLSAGRGSRTAMAVWVPNRNALFINIAASFAESMKADVIVTGFNREEGITFPDNSAKFIKAVNNALGLSTMGGPKARGSGHLYVKSYTQDMDKIDIMRCAIRRRLPVWDCWPCYRGGRHLCGTCESCARFLAALEKS